MSDAADGMAGQGPRIVAHTLSYPPHRRIGAELATHGLLTYLAACGWHAIVVPHSVERPRGAALEWDPYELDGVHVVPPAIGRTVRPDVVLAHAGFYAQAREQADRWSVPLVLSGHGGPPGWLCAQVSSVGPDLVIVNSETMRANIERTGLPMVVCRPPVWPEHGDGSPWRSTPRGDSVTLINPTPEKGVLVVGELAKRLPDVPFLLVGGGYGTQVGLNLPNVGTLPHGTRMPMVWDSTRVLVMPSLEESWGMAAAEAMMHGIPVLGSTAPGLAECIGLSGTRVEDTDGWERALEALLEPATWQDAHIRALRRAAELHPAPDLLRIRRVLENLTGREHAVGTRRYRNVRTMQEVDIDESDVFMTRRLDGLREVWERIDVGQATPEAGLPAPAGPVPPQETAGPAGPAADEPQWDPAAKIPELTAPKITDGVAKWVDYAVAHGADRATAERLTKAALIGLYAGTGR